MYSARKNHKKKSINKKTSSQKKLFIYNYDSNIYRSTILRATIIAIKQLNCYNFS